MVRFQENEKISKIADSQTSICKIAMDKIHITYYIHIDMVALFCIKCGSIQLKICLCTYTYINLYLGHYVFFSWLGFNKFELDETLEKFLCILCVIIILVHYRKFDCICVMSLQWKNFGYKASDSILFFKFLRGERVTNWNIVITLLINAP